MRPNARLVLLTCRRAVPPALLIAALFVVGPAVAASRPTAAVGMPERVARGLARQELWTALLVVLVPVLVARTAGAVERWRRGEVEWLACSRGGLSGALVSTWLGAAAAGTAALALAALEVHWLVGTDPSPERLVAVLDTDRAVLAVDGDIAVIDIPVPKGGWPESRDTSVRVPLRASGPVRAVVAATTDDGSSVVDVAGSHATLVIRMPSVPEGGLRLERAGTGAPIFVPQGAVELVGPSRAGTADAGLLARAAGALAGWLGLALALAAWTRPPTALFGLGVVQAAVWLADRPPVLWPGADLPDALARVATGVAPAAPGAAAVLGGVAVGLAGTALAAASPDAGKRR